MSASSNRSKGDSGPTEWLPERRSFWCSYVKQYVAVKYRWQLSVQEPERSGLERQLVDLCDNLHVAKPWLAPVGA